MMTAAILNMTAGQPIDSLVARWVMGWELTDTTHEVLYPASPEEIRERNKLPIVGPWFQPSRNPVDSRIVADKLRADGWIVYERSMPDGFPFLLDGLSDREGKILAVPYRYVVVLEYKRMRTLEDMENCRRRPLAYGNDRDLVLCQAALMACCPMTRPSDATKSKAQQET
jgi:hypothetical protein